MLYNNPMRYGADTFGEQNNSGGVTLTKSALLVAKEPLDCSAVNSVTEIQISGLEPEGTTRRFCFIVDDKLYKFVDAAATLCTGDCSLENVLAVGNTAAELAALKPSPPPTL